MPLNTAVGRSAKPPAPLGAHKDTPPEEYDINFCFDVPEVMENDRVRLEVFVPSLHAPAWFDASSAYRDNFAYLPYGPWDTLDHFLAWFEDRIRSTPGEIMYVIKDKLRTVDGLHTPSGSLAGVIGLLNSSPDHLTTEIGHVSILPPFQRTYVTTNACGLLLHLALDPPGTAAGLRLRRVMWTCNAANLPSRAAAERLGFTLEGTARWHRVLPPHKAGLASASAGLAASADVQQLIRDEEARRGPARHTPVLSLCWDDWQRAGKSRVQALMNR